MTHPLQKVVKANMRLAKTERFHGMAQADINKYDLPVELAEYANEYCNNSFIGRSFLQDVLKYKEK